MASPMYDPYAGGWQPFTASPLIGIGQGLAGLGAGLLSGRNWSEGLSRGLLGANQGIQQGLQDARRDYYVDQQGRYMQRRMRQEDKAQERQDAADARKAQAVADLSAHPPAGVDPQQWASMVAADPEGMASAYGKSLFEPAKPPTVHTFNEGGMAVDKQFNPKTGTWDVLSSAPRWQPAQAPEQWVDVKDAQGNVIGQRSSRSGKYDPYPSAAPKTLEERDQQTLLTGDPGSPEYAMAYTRTYLNPRFVQGTDAQGNATMVPIMPTVPPNVRKPTYGQGGGAPTMAPRQQPAAPGGPAMGGPAGAPRPTAAAGTPGQPTVGQPIVTGVAKGQTEDARKNAQLYQRSKQQLGIALQGYDTLASTGQQIAGSVPMIGSALQSGPAQQSYNALLDIAASYLYSVSGATANPGEVANLARTIMPAIGDAPATLADKKARLQQMVESIGVRAGATGQPQGAPPAAGAGAPVIWKRGPDGKLVQEQ